jgi:hypothetical protein
MDLHGGDGSRELGLQVNATLSRSRSGPPCRWLYGVRSSDKCLEANANYPGTSDNLKNQDTWSEWSFATLSGVGSAMTFAFTAK